MDDVFDKALDDYAASACDIQKSFSMESIAQFTAADRRLWPLAEERFGDAAFDLVRGLVRERYDAPTRRAIWKSWRYLPKRVRPTMKSRGGSNDGGIPVHTR